MTWFDLIMKKTDDSPKEFFLKVMDNLFEKDRVFIEEFIMAQYKFVLDEICKLRAEDTNIKWSAVFEAILLLINKKECAKIFMRIELQYLNSASHPLEFMTVLGTF